MRAYSLDDLVDARELCVKAVAGSLPPSTIVASIPVGSAAVNGRGEDVDFCVLIESTGAPLHERQLPVGWIPGGSADSGDLWESWKHTTPDGIVVNAIITNSPELFEMWRSSTEVCKMLVARYGAINKATRVAVHRIIQENASAESAFGDIPESHP